MFTSEIKESLVKILGSLGIVLGEGEIKIEHPADFINGDYSSNIAMLLSAKLKAPARLASLACKRLAMSGRQSEAGRQSAEPKLKTKNFENDNPKEIAEKIVSKWQERGLPDFVEKVEVAGPGFINIWLSFDSLGKYLGGLLKEDFEVRDFREVGGVGKKKTLVIDYSAPNIAKPFGIGHLRSTNIGQAIYNLYKYLGWNVIGDNHLGDWGTQFGKLIYMITRHHNPSSTSVILRSEATKDPDDNNDPNCLNSQTNSPNGILRSAQDDNNTLKNLTIEDLEKLYVEFHKEAETHPEMEEKAREWFKKLEEGDKEAKEIWQACVDISLKEFDRVYNLLGVKIDYAFGESFYQDKMGAVLDGCKEKGLLKESQGAQVVELQGMEIPAMLVKSDGATTYLLRDLAAVKFRKEKWSPDLLVYEVGADQTFHFAQLFKLCVLLDYGKLNQFVHIAHGLIRWPTGKFSTRKGDTIHLEEVLDEAIKRAAIIGKNVGSQRDAPEIDVGAQCIAPAVEVEAQRDAPADIAQAVGIGAIKYNDLKQNPRTDIIFDWEQILSLQGNSGPYLQYCYARTQSVLAKAKLSLRGGGTTTKQSQNCFGGKPLATTIEEISILRTIYRFPEVIEEAAREFSPNLLCNFLFDLCQKFNFFYDKHRILNAKRKTENGKPKLKAQSEDGPTEEQSNFRLLLTAAAGQVLKNGLAILGIEPLEKM